MRKLLLTVATVGICGAAPALAADLPVAPVAAFTWNGCYVGVNGGWMWGREDVDTSLANAFVQPGNIFAVPPAQGRLDRSFRIDADGGTAGVTFGCNIQTGVWVWGLETDTNWAGIKETASVRFGITDVGQGALRAASSVHTVTKQLDWFSTYRLRTGVAFDRWFGYVTGGAVVAGVKGTTDIQYNNDAFFLSTFHFAGSDRDVRMGWTVGGGFEYAFTNAWSFKAEYLYINLADFTFNAPCISPNAAGACIPGNSFSTATSIDFREHVFRVGLNYRIGGPLF
jgi:outer membrane immunogenic protein